MPENNPAASNANRKVSGHAAGIKDTATAPGVSEILDLGSEVGITGGATGVGGLGGATSGAGAGGAASGDRTIVGINPDSIGVTSPADSDGARPGAAAAATGGVTSGNALSGDSSSLHPGGLHPGPGSGSGAK